MFILVPSNANPPKNQKGSCLINKLWIGKYTLASTDSYRDFDMVQLIFPEAVPQVLHQFNQDTCARASKVFIPGSCFKIHAPETRYSEGYLPVKTLENEYNKKFYAVINGYSDYNFDAFFDNNMGFWVESLDKYLQVINDNDKILTSYIGLKWYHNDIKKTFYSLIIQSPDSQTIFELISFQQPNASDFPNLRANFDWKETKVMRASFKQYDANSWEYPWDSSFDIYPIRISFACSNVQKQMEFYTQIMGANVLYSEENVIDSLDSVDVSFVFLQLPGTKIEIQYIQRPIDYTYGTFTTEIYTNLLLKTHADIINGPYCGINRWMDNHYGLFQTKDYEIENYLYFERVLENVEKNKLNYRIYWTNEKGEDQSERATNLLLTSGKVESEIKNAIEHKYKIFLFDNNGQTIQMFGYLFNKQWDEHIPQWSKQWCASACPENVKMGKVEEGLVYIEDENDIVSKAMNGYVDNNTTSHYNYKVLIIAIVVSFIGIIGVSLFFYCVYKWYKYKVNGVNDKGENQPLLQGV